jgi:uncharacterized caspase-like protein
MAQRIALLIGNHHYQDKILAQLKSPATDIAGLASVLRDPAIGNFNQVEILKDRPVQEIRLHLQHLFRWRKKHDLLLLYFAGHTIVDEAGQLYLAAVDSTLDSLRETTIPAQDLIEAVNNSFSQQKILLFDGYYSGISTPERKRGDGVGTADAFKGNEAGHIVLAAADTLHYLLQGDEVLGTAEDSAFTHYLIQGLRTGAADADEDGQIGIGELYTYLYAQLKRSTAPQTPRKWSYSEQDEFIIARNLRQMRAAQPIKWDLIFGAIMAPTVTIVIGSVASLSTSVGMAGLILLIYAFLYYLLD